MLLCLPACAAVHACEHPISLYVIPAVNPDRDGCLHLCPAISTVTISSVISSLPKPIETIHVVMTPLYYTTSQQASPSPGSIRPHKAFHLHFPRTALRSAARVAPPLLHSADAGSVQALLSPSQKSRKKRCNAAKEGGNRCKPPCAVLTVLKVQVQSELHTDRPTADFVGSTAA